MNKRQWKKWSKKYPWRRFCYDCERTQCIDGHPIIDAWYLDGHTPRKCTTYRQLIEMFEGVRFDGVERRRVAQTTLPDGTWISTMFLVLNHSYIEGATPALFETMIFSPLWPEMDNDQYRYCTWEEAYRGHKAMCAHATLYIADQVNVHPSPCAQTSTPS